MAKNAAIGNLNLAVVGLSEKAINILIDLAHRYGGERGQDWMRKTSEMVANGLTCFATIKVDSSLTPEAALKAVGRVEHVTKEVLDAMPRGQTGSVEVVITRIGRNTPAAKLSETLMTQGLALADPFTAMAYIAANREFADSHPSATQWQDANGNYCWIGFARSEGVREVYVRHHHGDWDDGWWFVCVPISTSN